MRRLKRKSRKAFALVEVLVSLAILGLCLGLLFGVSRWRASQLAEVKFLTEAERVYMLASSQLIEDLHSHSITKENFFPGPYSYALSNLPAGWSATIELSVEDQEDINPPTTLLIEAAVKIEKAKCPFKAILDQVNNKKKYRFCWTEKK